MIFYAFEKIILLSRFNEIQKNWNEKTTEKFRKPWVVEKSFRKSFISEVIVCIDNWINNFPLKRDKLAPNQVFPFIERNQKIVKFIF